MKRFSTSVIGKPLYDNRYVLLSGGCAVFIMLLVYFCFNVRPFGDMTVLRMDLYHQYGPLFGELFERWKNLDSMLYSFKSGLGSNFLGNYYNYLSSPLSLIILLFGHKRIPQAIATMILLKAAFASGSFTYYIKKTFGKHDFSSAAFGLMYAFCGWFVAFYWNVMWVDALALFPLVVLGVQNIIDKGKPWLYCISLAVTLFANYYMGYMTCIFAFVYFFIYYFANYGFNDCFVNKLRREKTTIIKAVFRWLRNSRFFRSGVRFAVFSVIAGCLTAVSLIPVYFALKNCSATSGTFPVDYKSYFKIFDFLANHIAGVDPTIRSSGNDVLPNVYCGVLTVILIPLYLFNRNIRLRQKITHIILLAILFFSFNINYANYVWHGFHFPNDLPYRFSFMYSFVLLVMAYRAFCDIKQYPAKTILASGLAVIAFVVLAQKLQSKNVTELAVWITIGFTVAYTLILNVFKNKEYKYAIVALLLLCTCGSEIAVANTGNYSMGQSYTAYYSNYSDFNNMNDMLEKQDDGFYRLEQSNLLTRMDNSWYYYNGSSVFSSLAYERLSNMMRDIGFMSNYINSYTYHPQTAVYNAMFDIKYLFDNDESVNNDELYENLFGNDTYKVYKNRYTLPIAYGANSDVKNWTTMSTINPFVLQADLFSAASGVENVFKNIPISYVSYSNIEEFYPDEIRTGVFYVQKQNSDDEARFTIEFIVPETQNVYFYLKARNVKSVSASGDFLSKSQTMDKNYNIIDLGLCHEGEIIYVDAFMDADSSNETMEFYAAGLDMDRFRLGFGMLEKNQMNITGFSETDITGKVEMDRDGVLFTTIPYDKGWKIFVDGEKADCYAINEALLALDISAGSHTVEFRFVPEGLIIGAAVSAAALLFVVILLIILKKSKSFSAKRTENWWGYDNTEDDIEYEKTKLIVGTQQTEASVPERKTDTSIISFDDEQNKNGE
jgi:uncharacterized membrane protein YfhO